MPRTLRLVMLAIVMVIAMNSCSTNPLPIPKEDRNRQFGKDAFTIITEVDKNDPSLFLLKGTVGIKQGKMTSSMPGAVFVVGVEDDVIMGGKTFTSRQIILLTSTPEYILAPPGMTITLPADVEVFGKTYKAGKFTVPEDSKFPDTLE